MGYEISWSNDWQPVAAESGESRRIDFDGHTYAVYDTAQGEVPGDAACSYTACLGQAREWARESVRTA